MAVTSKYEMLAGNVKVHQLRREYVFQQVYTVVHIYILVRHIVARYTMSLTMPPSLLHNGSTNDMSVCNESLFISNVLMTVVHK